ncbi:hypothetical protein [Streptomyces sp. F-1]|uniref:hypothetical protein n=1 Tax=Streptomyces sp. F-1 TaxID=463642 RepID=UPI0031F31380
MPFAGTPEPVADCAGVGGGAAVDFDFECDFDFDFDVVADVVVDVGEALTALRGCGAPLDASLRPSRRTAAVTSSPATVGRATSQPLPRRRGRRRRREDRRRSVR